MAGQLTIDTLKASSGVLATQNGMTGIAKAWVSVTGTTGAILSSFNISSVTRTAAGNYTVNFTTALSDANYAVNATGRYVNATANSISAYPYGTKTTSSVQIGAAYASSTGGIGTWYDYDIFVSVFGS